ncbi:hypothetical protein GCM10028803_28980 [Larkinella knui]|uniref:Tetratricopeptide repeat protein n=1 Tax=Larkinella knui TaxID=2025310 RepID=A0A3P1CX05_9BACT|nr:hypothetical protein [Larkinella knui]RRB17932.1 hypothetical protein EHT87_06560 [Larkinella knui]
MKLTQAQFELIEAYLNHELSETDRLSFERDLQAEDELRSAVDRQREMRLGLQAVGIQRALERAKTQYKENALADGAATKPAARVLPLNGLRYWAAAASVVVVLGVGYYAYQQTASRQADLAYTETFTDNDEVMKNFPSEHVSTQTRTTFFEAFKNYKAGNYDRVIGQLKTLPADKQTIHYKNYLLGLSYLANRQPTEAIPLLDKARQTALPELHQKTEWFLALAYVKNNQKERALPLLKRISSDQAHPFQSLAQRVIRKIQ